MGDALRKVARGEPLDIPAMAYNAFIDAAKFARAQQGKPQEPRPQGSGNETILIQNNSGSGRNQFDILTIGPPLIGPGDNEPEFKSRLALSGTLPAAAVRGTFAVLQEPAAAGSIARALLSGTTLVKILFPDSAAYPFADVADAQSGYLAPAPSGAAMILWRESGTGLKWALVRLGNAVSTLFPVALTQTGGSQGTSSAAASWTYRISDIFGNTLATAVNPANAPHKWKRPAVGFLTAATFGYAHYDSTGALALGWINEVAEQEACS